MNKDTSFSDKALDAIAKVLGYRQATVMREHNGRQHLLLVESEKGALALRENALTYPLFKAVIRQQEALTAAHVQLAYMDKLEALSRQLVDFVENCETERLPFAQHVELIDLHDNLAQVLREKEHLKTLEQNEGEKSPACRAVLQHMDNHEEPDYQAALEHALSLYPDTDKAELEVELNRYI